MRFPYGGGVCVCCCDEGATDDDVDDCDALPCRLRDCFAASTLRGIIKLPFIVIVCSGAEDCSVLFVVAVVVVVVIIIDATLSAFTKPPLRR